MKVFHNLASFTIQNAVVRLRHDSGVTAFIRLLPQPFFRLATPPADRGMACQAVKKAVSKTDGLLKAGGV